jgi:hypothetical protein
MAIEHPRALRTGHFSQVTIEILKYLYYTLFAAHPREKTNSYGVSFFVVPVLVKATEGEGGPGGIKCPPVEVHK